MRLKLVLPRNNLLFEMGNEKHEEIRRLSSSLIEKNLKVFQPLLFSLNSVKEHVKKSSTQQQILSTYFIFSDRFCLITQSDFVREFEQGG